MGWYLVILTAGHLFPALVALFSGETALLDEFLLSAAIMGFIAGALLVSFRGTFSRGKDRAVMIAAPVVLMFATPLLAGGPFLTSGVLASPVEAYFEAASGLSSAGASILPARSTLPESIIAWRAFLEWTGGFTGVLIVLVFLTSLDIGGLSLFASALPHGEGAGLVDRLRLTFHVLGRFYTGLTLAAAILLWLAGLPVLDGLVLAMSAISTGGFLAIDGGLVAYDNVLVEAIVAIFLIIGSLNLTFHWAVSRGRTRQLLNDPETRAFARSLLLAILLSAFVVAATIGFSLGETVSAWDVIFLSISALSTSGMSTVPQWSLPLSFITVLLMLAMFGGTTGSTTGGLRQLRIILLWGYVRSELSRLAHPHGVTPVVYHGQKVDVERMMAVWTVVFGFSFAIVIGALGLSALGIPYGDAINVTLACISGAAPLAVLADTGFPGYAAMSGTMLALSAGLMIFGRVELVLAAIFVGLLRLRD